MKCFWLNISLVGIAFLLMACSQTYPACENDEDCAEQGEFCLDSTCAQCRVTENCVGECQQCEGGVCAVVAGCCSDTIACPGGQTCRDGFCGAECLAHADCPSGAMCQNGKCVQQTAACDCARDSDCNDTSVCVDCMCEESTVCKLRSIYFDFDEDSLRTDQMSSIEDNASCIDTRALNALNVTGHADERGTEDYNLKLGNSRAKNVKKALKGLGVGVDLSTYSKGEYDLIVHNARTEDEHQKNRRVELESP